MIQPGIVGGGHQSDTPPTITSNGGGPTASIPVTAPATAVTTVTATGAGVKTFSITGGAQAALFQIDPVTGVLTFKVASTVGSKAVTVAVTSGYGQDTQAITVTVT